MGGLVPIRASEPVKEGWIKPQSACFQTGVGCVTRQQHLPHAPVGGCSAELGRGAWGWANAGITQPCCDLGKPLCPHCPYFFYHPHKVVNCFANPRAALLISCYFIHSSSWKRWVSLVFAPMQREKKASHKSSSEIHKRWMVWGIQLSSAKWMKHQHSALHLTSTIIRVRMKYEFKAFAQQPSSRNEISVLWSLGYFRLSGPAVHSIWFRFMFYAYQT